MAEHTREHRLARQLERVLAHIAETHDTGYCPVHDCATCDVVNEAESHLAEPS